MPVYWFALSQVITVNWMRALGIFFILHLLVYPASNGYNSFMDRDTTSVGGIRQPLQPAQQLLWFCLAMDLFAVMLSLFISIYFALGILAYILASRAYSHRGIRLKKYPLIGYLTVVLFQGAATFGLVYHGAEIHKTLQVPVLPMLISSLLIGGFYPLTQIYQHEADLKDGVHSISYRLGYRGTFVFCAILYTIAFSLLTYYFFHSRQEKAFYVMATCMLPILVYFMRWAIKVWKQVAAANYVHAMRMNVIASLCTNLGFIILTTGRLFE